MIENPVDNHTFISQFVNTIFTSIFPIALSLLDITKFRVTAIFVVQKCNSDSLLQLKCVGRIVMSPLKDVHPLRTAVHSLWP
jgi:hypothetical protein